MGDADDNEREPLISNRASASVSPPYEWGPGAEADQSASYDGPSGANDGAFSSLPSEMEGSLNVNPTLPSRDGAGCGVAMVTCRVCQKNIDITGRTEQHVVKCSNCKEATPIRNAPPGKKYVRCSCNCLLICKSSSQRIACPRADCERVINLNSPTSPAPLTNANLRSVICAHCNNTFLFNPNRKALAKCPYCGKVSAVGSDFIRRRSTGYIIAAVIVFAVAIGVTVGTYRHALIHGGIFVAYIGAFIVGAFLLIRAIHYRRIKVSSMQEA